MNSMKIHVPTCGNTFSFVVILLCILVFPDNPLMKMVLAESQCETDTAALIADNPELQKAPITPDDLVAEFSDWKNCLSLKSPTVLSCEVDASQNATDYNATCQEAGGNYDTFRIDVECTSSNAVASAVGAKVTYSLINIQQCVATSCTEAEIEETLQTVTDQVSQGIEDAGFGEGCTTNITTTSAGSDRSSGLYSTTFLFLSLVFVPAIFL